MHPNDPRSFSLDPRLVVALFPGEHVLWHDRPDPETHAARGGPPPRPLMTFALVAVPFAVGLLIVAAFTGGRIMPDSFIGTRLDVAVVGLPVLAGVLAALWGETRHAARLRRARRVLYAITDRRLLIIGDDGAMTINPFRHPPADWRLLREGQGRGSLLFGTPEPGEEPAFYGVREVERVAHVAFKVVTGTLTSA